MRTILAHMIAWLAVAGLTTGCLSQSHVIPGKSLQVLAQSDPNTRGQRVRVIQGLGTETEPPSAPAVDSGGNTVIVVHTSNTRSGPQPPPKPRRPSAKSSADDAKFWILLAAAVAIGAAATEGTRFDGWVQLHPMHPVHLYGWDGSYSWAPLAEITPEVAAQTRKAIVREAEGPWTRLERAPLDRAGWTYSMLLGSSEVPMIDSAGRQVEQRGFIAHIQFGRYLSQFVGLVFDQSMGWASNEFDEVVYDSRSSLELQYMPVSLGVLHAGGFGQIGLGYRLDDTLEGKDKRGYLLSGGGMLQLELTTRLTITARAALTQVYGTRTGDFTVGVSIY